MIEIDDDPLARDVWYDKLHFCCCADQEAVLEFLLQVVDVHRMSKAETLHEDLSALIARNPRETRMLVQYVLNAADLLEHGGSVNYGWPTDLGNQLLERRG